MTGSFDFMEKLSSPLEGIELKGILNAWIDLNGKFYPVYGFGEHNNWATNYLESQFDGDRITKLLAVEKLTGSLYACEYLVEEGWIRMVNWGLPNEKSSVTLDYRFNQTSGQRSTLEEWLLWNKGFTFNVP